jgi:hypothetical protein
MKKSRTKTLAWIFGLLLSIITIPANAASISPQIAILCVPNKDTYITWTNTSAVWTITHADNYEKFDIGTATISQTISHIQTLTAKVTASTGATYSSPDTVLGSLEFNVNIQLQAAGTTTRKTTYTTTNVLVEIGTHVFYRGNKLVTGFYTEYKCNGMGTAYNVESTGKAVSFNTYTQGVLFCGIIPPTSSLAYVVKNVYCP